MFASQGCPQATCFGMHNSWTSHWCVRCLQGFTHELRSKSKQGQSPFNHNKLDKMQWPPILDLCFPMSDSWASPWLPYFKNLYINFHWRPRRIRSNQWNSLHTKKSMSKAAQGKALSSRARFLLPLEHALIFSTLRSSFFSFFFSFLSAFSFCFSFCLLSSLSFTSSSPASSFCRRSQYPLRRTSCFAASLWSWVVFIPKSCSATSTLFCNDLMFS